MNFDYSIEDLIDRINNTKTKEYFNEVYQTYVNGNYRSSIVMLYSVLICDLIFKLRDLRDIYGDKVSTKILSEIEEFQKAKPTSPDWENKLIEDVNNQRSIFDISDKLNIDFLQKQRHLSAHPVLTSANLLYAANKETVQSSMKNILEGILIKPPLFTNKIFEYFIKDLAEIKDKLPEQQDLEKYLDARYFKKLNDFHLARIFRSLWKVSLITDDELSIENHHINIRTLRIMLRKYYSICFEALKAEKSYFSNISKQNLIKSLIILLADFPKIFSELEDPLKLLINERIKADDECKLISWFKDESLKAHFEKMDPRSLKKISFKSCEFLINVAIDNNAKKEAVKFVIDFFDSSDTFEIVLRRYVDIISNLLYMFDDSDYEYLLSVSNANSNIYHRFEMPDYLKRNALSRFGDSFDLSRYPKLFRKYLNTKENSENGQKEEQDQNGESDLPF